MDIWQFLHSKSELLQILGKADNFMIFVSPWEQKKPRFKPQTNLNSLVDPSILDYLCHAFDWSKILELLWFHPNLQSHPDIQIFCAWKLVLHEISLGVFSQFLAVQVIIFQDVLFFHQLIKKNWQIFLHSSKVQIFHNALQWRKWLLYKAVATLGSNNLSN